MNLFGKAKAAGPTIIKLRQTLETLEKREQHLGKKIEAQIAEARAKSQRNDRRGAIYALKRKKLFDQEVNKIQGARMTLESQIAALESATINVATYEAMREGTRAMQGVHQRMDVERVEEVVDDLQEEMSKSEEVSNLLASGVGVDLDDDELLEELNELEAADAELELEARLMDAGAVPAVAAAPAAAAPAAAAAIAAAMPAIPDMPLAPSGPLADSGIQVSGDADEAELEALRQLEASMA